MIRHPNFNKAPQFQLEGILSFIKPLGSKYHYVLKVCETFAPQKRKEIIEVLNTLCDKKEEESWLFLLQEKETQENITLIFEHMDVPVMLVKLDAERELSN